ncbi:MAG: PIN domain-containing protein [Deltaproteobacteria bacterium]|nr:PIN domain-containing protein [Deltaproteobacteria bacterium]
MGDVLVDTSAWITALRGTDPAVRQCVDRLLENDRILFCGVVAMELLRGMRPPERRELLPLFEALSFVELDRADWRSAGELLNTLRSEGREIPATDALIAALCLRHGAALFSLDKHFDRIPELKRFAADDSG